MKKKGKVKSIAYALYSLCCQRPIVAPFEAAFTDVAGKSHVPLIKAVNNN